MSKLSRSILFYFFVLFIPLTLQGYQSAHIIAVGQCVDTNGVKENCVFLGLMSKGKLSTFGGFREEDELDPKQTAAREMEEEALGVLGDQKEIRNMLSQVKPLFDANGHICYVLFMKNIGNDVSAKFKKLRFSGAKLTKSQKEMVDIVPISAKSIREKVLRNEELLFEDNEGVQRPIRIERVFIEAVLQGCL